MARLSVFIISVFTLLGLVGGIPTVWAQRSSIQSGHPQKQAPTLDAATDRLIVKYKNPNAFAKQRTLSPGVRNRRYLRHTQIEIVELQAGVDRDTMLKELRNSSDVDYAEPDYRYQHFAELPSDPNFSELWGLHNTGQSGGTQDADIDWPEAHEWLSNNPGAQADVVVAVLDTGIDTKHPDLINNLWVNTIEAEGTEGVDDDGNGYIDDIHGINAITGSGDPMDDVDHGTHVSGTIAASINNQEGLTGVFPSAKIMGLKFLGEDGGLTSDAIESIEYILEMKSRGVPVSVVNNSWGGGYYSAALYEAIGKLREQNVLFVVAAGNSEINTDLYAVYPASYSFDNIISVAATDRNDVLADFSNYGWDSVDIAAPGKDIFSTVPSNQDTIYHSYSGTSMAAPHVAGVVAMMQSYYGNRTYRDLRDILIHSADPLAGLSTKVKARGRLNALNALQYPTENIPPMVEHYTPKRGAEGTRVTISGSRFGESQGSISFGKMEASIVRWQDDSIQFEIPEAVSIKQFDLITADSRQINDFPLSIGIPLELDSYLLEAVNRAAATSWGKQIYVMGGYLGGFSNRQHPFQIYDTEARLWYEGPEPLEVTADAASSLWQNRLYFTGGLGGDGFENSVQIFDPESSTWTQGTSLPAKLRGHKSVVVQDTLWILAGENDSYISIPQIYAWNAESQGWDSKASMSVGRFQFGSAVVDEKIYAFGGIQYRGVSDQGTFLDSMEVYDPTTDQWQTLAPLPSALAFMSTAVYGGKIYVIGGVGSNYDEYLDVIWSYDPATDQWSEEKYTLNTVALGANSLLVQDKIYVVGGYHYDGETKFHDVVERWDLTAPQVLKVSQLQASMSYGVAPLNSQFSVVLEGGSGNYDYQWDFGDQTSSTEAQPQHTFSDPGQYTVRVQVSDQEHEQEALGIFTVHVESPALPPSAIDLEATAMPEQPPFEVEFTATLSGGSAPYRLTLDWGTEQEVLESNTKSLQWSKTFAQPSYDLSVQTVDGQSTSLNSVAFRREKQSGIQLNPLPPSNRTARTIWPRSKDVQAGRTGMQDPMADQLWTLHNTGQSGGSADVDIDWPEAWNQIEGQNLEEVVVAVIGQGIDINHPDLIDNIWTNPLEAAGEVGVDDDQNGYIDDIHGLDLRGAQGGLLDTLNEGSDSTHLAGIVAASLNNQKGIHGVNPRVKLLIINNHDDHGRTFLPDVATKYLTALETRGVNIRVVFSAYQRFIINDSYYDNQLLADHDILHVTAFNQTPDHWGHNKGPSNILKVAATDHNDLPLSDAINPAIDMFAPGGPTISLKSTDYSLDSSSFLMETVESGANGWEAESPWAILEKGTNNHAWKIELTNEDSLQVQRTLTSPVIDLQEYSGKKLIFGFDLAMDRENLTTLEFSKDGGTTWELMQVYKNKYILVQDFRSYLLEVPSEFINDQFRFRFLAHREDDTHWDIEIAVDNMGLKVMEIQEAYVEHEGIGVAVAHTAGSASLLFAANPDLSATQVKHLLMQSGDDLPEWADSSFTGKRLNVHQALNLSVRDLPVWIFNTDVLQANFFSTVTITGSLLGETPGKVVFANGVEAPIVKWKSKEIQFQVPLDALSGDIHVETADGKQSNALRLDVGKFLLPEAEVPHYLQVNSAFAQVDQNLYFVGGGEYEAMGTMAIYNADEKLWSQGVIPEHPMSGATATTYNGKIYFFGGFKEVDENYNVEYLSSVVIFDPTTNQWQTGADLPRSFAYGQAVTVNNKILVMGGTYETADTIATLSHAYFYDPATESWEDVGPMEHPRYAFGAWAHQGKVYVFGGENYQYDGEAGTFELNDVMESELYDPEANEWSSLPPMHYPRNTFGTTLWNGEIYAVGGIYSWDQYRNPTIEIFNPETESWRLSPYFFGQKNSWYHYLNSVSGAAVFNNKLIIVDLNRVQKLNDAAHYHVSNAVTIESLEAIPALGSIQDPIRFQVELSRTHNLEYLWDFGDGNSSRLLHPEHQFQTTGTYTVHFQTREIGTEDWLTQGKLMVTVVENASAPTLTMTGNTEQQGNTTFLDVDLNPSQTSGPLDYQWTLNQQALNESDSSVQLSLAEGIHNLTAKAKAPSSQAPFVHLTHRRVQTKAQLLPAGWNMVYLEEGDIETFMETYPSVQSIWTWDTDEWAVRFQGILSDQFKELTNIEADRGYWLSLSAPTSLPISLTGFESNQTMASMVPEQTGWHLIGSPEPIYNLGSYFAEFPQLKNIWVWQGGSWSIYTPGDVGERNQFNEEHGTHFENLRKIEAHQGAWVQLQ